MKNNYFEKQEGFDVDNIYSDLNITKFDIIGKNSTKISTLNKPYIWRNHVYNLPTNTKLEHSNSKYSIGIEIIHCTCLPVSLFKILSKRELYNNYGYRVRSYRDINSSSFVSENLKLENILDDEQDCINKFVSYDEEKVRPVFMETMFYGYNENGEQHRISAFYFKEVEKKNSFFFLFETEIKSDLAKKIVTRNMGFHIFGIKNPIIDEVSTRQFSTIKERGMFIGDYESEYLKIMPNPLDKINTLYEK